MREEIRESLKIQRKLEMGRNPFTPDPNDEQDIPDPDDPEEEPENDYGFDFEAAGITQDDFEAAGNPGTFPGQVADWWDAAAPDEREALANEARDLAATIGDTEAAREFDINKALIPNVKFNDLPGDDDAIYHYLILRSMLRRKQ